ncbi:hypothetical protein [Tenacibaculum sp. 190524A02b]|uniref:hypothetical protein n=1 Tax=Tenacibaculum vairaonense TaxID=3137860 RepID=UPI0032B0F9BF
MEQLALGELGLSLEYFYSLTSRQFFNTLTGYREKERLVYQDDWERSRMQMYFTVLPYLDKNNQIAPEDLFVFPWEDEKSGAGVSSREELENYFKDNLRNGE